MSPSNLGSALFIGVEGSVYVPSKTDLPHVHGRLQGISYFVACVNACMCICVRVWLQAFTFYFTLKAVSVLLRRWFLLGFLVVLLGTLVIVVHPLNCILLQEKTSKGII